MDNANKLFQSSEIEYITPFLKLWLSFNSWYKKQYRRNTTIRTDRDHLEKIKIETNLFKTEFEYLLNSNNVEWLSHLEELLKGLNNSDLKKYETDLIYRHPDDDNAILLKDLFIQSFSESTFRARISSHVRKNDNLYFISSTEDVFKLVLELIYLVRCSLVHGSLSIDNQTNLDVVESAYHLLFEVLKGVFRD